MKHLAVFWFAAAAFAQSAGLQYDPANPQAAFAATEIRRAFAARGQSLVEHSLVENGSPQTLRLVLSASNSNALAESLGVPRPKESTPQSYAIRRLDKGGVTTLAVLASDGAGAMYGGLDLAEAVRHPRYPPRRGPLALYRKARHQIQYPAGFAHSQLLR
jgi:hypothetical protein